MISLDKYAKKYGDIPYPENNIEFESDNVLGSGGKNLNWRYALHLDQNEDTTYICIIERE